MLLSFFFFFQAEDGIRDLTVTGVQTCALPISRTTLEAESIRRSILSSRIRANRLRILDEKNKIVQSVLKSVEKSLSNIASSDQFESTLKRFVAEAVEAVGTVNALVKIGFRNADKKSFQSLGQSLPKGTKLLA